MSHVLRFDTTGLIGCLYTEMINLASLGKLKVTRATEINFNEGKQQWEATDISTGEALFSDPSRDACIRWEHENLQPD
jgi:Na+(H+)/acetate symporter ActP